MSNEDERSLLSKFIGDIDTTNIDADKAMLQLGGARLDMGWCFDELIDNPLNTQISGFLRQMSTKTDQLFDAFITKVRDQRTRNELAYNQQHDWSISFEEFRNIPVCNLGKFKDDELVTRDGRKGYSEPMGKCSCGCAAIATYSDKGGSSSRWLRAPSEPERTAQRWTRMPNSVKTERTSQCFIDGQLDSASSSARAPREIDAETWKRILTRFETEEDYVTDGFQ